MGRREAREAREFWHHVGKAMYFVENPARPFLEIREKPAVLGGAQPPQRLDRGANGGKGVLHLVRDAPRHLAPRRNARRRREPPSRGVEILEHRIERSE